MSDNKWSLAFWIMATLCVGGMTFIGNSVIANDRIRANEDAKIADEVARRLETFQDKNAEQHLIMMGDLREIKTKLNIAQR